MPRILFSLVSEQTLPNVLFIRQFSPFDKYVFITTTKMEEDGRADAIIRTCNLSENANTQKLVVDPERKDAVIRVLENYEFDSNTDYTLHITGGTKIMALGAYDFFATRLTNNLSVYYIPVNSPSIYQIYPHSQELPLNVQINLPDYLSAYGVKIVEQESPDIWNNKFQESKQILAEIASGNVPNKILEAANQYYHSDDKRFYTGFWFEIWLACTVKQHFQLASDDIAMNMKLTRNTIESNEYTEYDVVFVRNNKLYVGECKYFSAGQFTKSKINKDWYKLAGLQLQMGLHATPFLITANQFPAQVKKYFADSHKLFRIRAYADINTIGNEQKILSFLNKL